MFAGSLRFNIDPTERHTDAEIWHALEAVELADKFRSSPNKLDTEWVGRFSLLIAAPA